MHRRSPILLLGSLAQLHPMWPMGHHIRDEKGGPPSGMRSVGFAASAPTPHCSCAFAVSGSAPSLSTSSSAASSSSLLPLLLSDGWPTPLLAVASIVGNMLSGQHPEPRLQPC